ncbi:recombinase family protein [Crateriforma spongiae]|uniref:recombinase family protein n=1 Tax=Crateriforma spongiae TaxID=2724528 RepID=UPI00144873EB|nr:recombinase family protein [Crateriforma spongiae]
MSKFTAVYCRVSSNNQDTASQKPDLESYIKSLDGDVKWFEDKASGKSMSRPEWERLERDARAGKVSRIVVWRLDRLGRTASGLTALFEDLNARKINLVSVRDGLDLSTPAGRLMANVLASVAQYETEVRGERVKAGQAVARANGKRWGGSKKGVRRTVNADTHKAIVEFYKSGQTITAVARAVRVSRPTVYSVLREAGILEPAGNP